MSEVSSSPTLGASDGSNINDTPHQLLQRFYASKDTEELTPQTPLEWCLDAAFASFVELSEAKLATVLKQNTEREIDLNAYFKETIDDAFDVSLRTLGSLAKHAPTLVIDSLMAWRDAASDLVDSDLPVASVRGSVRSSNAGTASRNTRHDLRVLAANILFCRASTEVIRHLTADKITDDVAFRLEDLAFSQMKNAVPELLRQSVNWQSHCTHFSCLLGGLSDIRFVSVSDRYVAELERLVSANLLRENKAEHVILGMRFLRMKIYPMDALEETAEFLESIGNFFMSTNDLAIRQVFIESFLSLLAPVCSIVTAEVNLPAWAKFVDSVFPRVCKMLFKLRHAPIGLQLGTTLLCLSRSDFFASNWMVFMDLCVQKFKERTLRNISLNCLNKLLWMYLFKYPENPNNAYKRLESLIRLLFPPNRRNLYPPEASLDSYIEIAYQIILRFPAWSMQNVIVHLIGSSAGTITNTEAVASERSIVCVRAFLHALDMNERGQNRAEFPSDKISSTIHASVSNHLLSNNSKVQQKFAEPLRLLNEIMSKALSLLDVTHGNMLLTDERWRIVGLKTSTSSGNLSPLDIGEPLQEVEYSAQLPILFVATITKERINHLELIKTLLRALPRITLAGIAYSKLLEMIARYTNHIDYELATTAHQTLLRLAQECGVKAVATVYNKYLLDITEKHIEVFDEFYTTLANDDNAVERKHAGMLTIYIDILQLWQNEQYGATREVTIDSAPTLDTTPAPATIVDVQRIEVFAMFTLCSHNPRVRNKALTLLDIASSLLKDQHPSLRLGTLLRNHVSEAMNKRPKVSLEQTQPEFQDSPSQSLVKYCAIIFSFRRKDIKWWAESLPSFALSLSEFLPDLAKSCWMIVADHIMQLHSIVCSSSDWGTSSGLLWTGKSIPPSDTKAAQWKFYCLFACGALSSTISMASKGTTVINLRASGSESLLGTNALTGNNSSGTDHGKGSESVRSRASFSHMSSARDFVSYLLTFLTSDHSTIRDATIESLEHCASPAAPIVTSELVQYLIALCDDAKLKLGKRYVHPRRPGRIERLRYELPRLIQLLCTNCDMTAAFWDGSDPTTNISVGASNEFITQIMNYFRLNRSLLAELRSNTEGDFYLLPVKKQFASCVERFYDCFLASIGTNAESSVRRQLFAPDLRALLFALFEEWCAHGLTKTLCMERTQKVHAFAMELVKDPKERVTTEKSIESQLQQLELVALEAMCSLCFISSPDTQNFDDDSGSMVWKKDEMERNVIWINDMLGSTNLQVVTIGRRALKALLQASANDELSDWIIRFCYTGLQDVLVNSGYFLALSNACIDGCYAEVMLDKLLILGILKSTSRDAEVRRQALRLLCYTEDSYFVNLNTDVISRFVLSGLPIGYYQAATLFSQSLATNHSDLTYGLLSELYFRLDTCHASAESRLFKILFPVLENVKMSSDVISQIPSKDSDFVLHNMLWLVARFSGDYWVEVDTAWKLLVVNENISNIPIILTYLLKLGMDTGTARVFGYVRQILYSISRSTSLIAMVQALKSEISPQAFIPSTISATSVSNATTTVPSNPAPTLTTDRDAGPVVTDHHTVFRAKLDFLPKNSSNNGISGSSSHHNKISRGSLASLYLIYLVDELPLDILTECMPLILHTVAVQVDHPNTLIFQQMRHMLQYLLQSVCHSNGYSPVTITPSVDVDLSTTTTLASVSNHGNTMWQHNDSRPVQLEQNVRLLMQGLMHMMPSVCSLWSTVALQWASTCTILHIAVRSLQVFRVLAEQVSGDMVVDLLSVLRNAMSDSNTSVRSFCEEIILTILLVIGKVNVPNDSIFTAVFWCCVVLLLSDDRKELATTLKVLNKLFDVLDFEDARIQAQVMSAEPRDWHFEFHGLQPLLLPMLRDSMLFDDAKKLINRMLFVEKDGLVDSSPGRWLFAMLVNLPLFLAEVESGSASAELQQVAKRLSEHCACSDAQNLSRLFTSLSKQKFKNVDDVLKYFTVLIREAYFPTFGYETMRLLLILVQNTDPSYSLYALKALKLFVPHVSNCLTQEQSGNNELIRLLLEELRGTRKDEILAVIDEVLVAVKRHTERGKYSTVLSHKASTINNRKARKPAANIPWLPKGTAVSRRTEVSTHMDAVMVTLVDACDNLTRSAKRDALVPYSTDYVSSIQKSSSTCVGKADDGEGFLSTPRFITPTLEEQETPLPTYDTHTSTLERHMDLLDTESEDEVAVTGVSDHLDNNEDLVSSTLLSDTASLTAMTSSLSYDHISSSVFTTHIAVNDPESETIYDGVVPTTILAESVDSLTSAVSSGGDIHKHTRWQSRDSDGSSNAEIDGQKDENQNNITLINESHERVTTTISSTSVYVSEDEHDDMRYMPEVDSTPSSVYSSTSLGVLSENLNELTEEDDEPPMTEVLDDSDSSGHVLNLISHTLEDDD